MVTWCSALLGDLEDADRVSAAGLAQVQPGQTPAWTLHLVAWRIYTLTMLGRWDEALSLGERARQLWLEAGRTSAGYSMRGFLCVIDVARARQDEATLEVHSAIIQEIALAFPESAAIRRNLGYERADLDAVDRVFVVRSDLAGERLERRLSLLLDHRRIPSTDRLNQALAWAVDHEFLLLEAQARRGLGLGASDTTELDRSFEIFERAGAVPYAARVQCERARLTGDKSDMEKGLRVLQDLGDTDQLGRYERRAVG
jgi:hypothetical protein